MITRVVVTGGRDYQNRERVFQELNALCGDVSEEHPFGTEQLVVIHGGCPTGADLWADEWIVVNWSQFEEYPANWDKYGKAAGPIRNGYMLKQSKPDLVLAFPGGRGTADCVRRAKAMNIPVREITDGN